MCWRLCMRCEQAEREVFLQQTPDMWHRGPSSSPGRGLRTSASGPWAGLCSSSAPAFLLNYLWKRRRAAIKGNFPQLLLDLTFTDCSFGWTLYIIFLIYFEFIKEQSVTLYENNFPSQAKLHLFTDFVYPKVQQIHKFGTFAWKKKD